MIEQSRPTFAPREAQSFMNHGGVIMSTRPLLRLLAALLLLPLHTACTAYQAASPSNIAPGSDVRVLFPSPAPVVMGYPEADSVRHAEIPRTRAVEGGFLSIVGDTMRLRPVWVLDAHAIETFASASFPLSTETRVAVRRFSPERTALLLLALGGVTYVIASSSSWEMDGASGPIW